jgi:hypothetical protein
VSGNVNGPTYKIRKEQKVWNTLQAGEELSGHPVKGLCSTRLHDKSNVIQVGEPTARLTKIPVRVDHILGAVLIQSIVVDAIIIEVFGKVVVDVCGIITLAAHAKNGVRSNESDGEDEQGPSTPG